MTYVGATPTTGDFKLLDSITTSSTTTFNLRQGGVAVYPQSANHCLVVLNGVLQTAGSSFNIVNDTIVFASSLSSSDVINQILVLGNVNDIGVPSDSTVTDAKIVDMAASKLTGTVAQANIADQAINEAKMQISNAPTNGYFLSAQSGNTGGLTWAEAGGGDLVLVASAEGTNSVGDVSINDCFSATYANYLITFAINNDRSGNYNNFRFQADDDSTFDNNYNYCLWGYDENGNLRTSFSNSGSACPLNSLETPDDDSWVFGSCTGYMYVYHPYTLSTGGLRRLRVIGQVFNIDTSGQVSGQSLQMQLKQNSYNVAGIRFRPSANYITERRVRVYGIKDS